MKAEEFTGCIAVKILAREIWRQAQDKQALHPKRRAALEIPTVDSPAPRTPYQRLEVVFFIWCLQENVPIERMRTPGISVHGENVYA